MVIYYFLPRMPLDSVAHGEGLNSTTLAAAGLADVLRDIKRIPQHAALTNVRSPAGPGRQSGTLIAPVSKHRGPPPIAPERITWRPVKDGQHLWLGALPDQPPTPLDLERWQQIGGAAVTDPRTYEWTIPVARAYHHAMPYGTLPQSFTFADDGQPQPNLSPEYAWLWELGGQLRDHYRALEGLPSDAPPAEQAALTPRPLDWLVQQAARVLAVNYRVGLAELNFLHALGHPVLTQQTVHAICRAVFGWEVFEEAKKKRPDDFTDPPPSSSPSTTGDDTPPAAPGTSPVGAPS